MTKKISQKEQEELNKFHDLLVKKMKKGKSQAQIVEDLVADGYTKKEAQTKVKEGYQFVLDLNEGERFNARAFVPALFGGLLGAAIAGGIWGLIVMWTNLENTYMASGVGLVVGFCITLFTKGRRGFPAIAIAFLFSIIGILIGRYITNYHFLKEKESHIPLFSQDVLDNFLENIDKTLDGANGVWIFLALVTAWKMTSRMGIRVKKEK